MDEDPIEPTALQKDPAGPAAAAAPALPGAVLPSGDTSGSGQLSAAPPTKTDTNRPEGPDSLSTAYSETGPEKSSQIDAGSSFVSTTSGSPTTSRQDQKAWFEQGVKDRDAANASRTAAQPTQPTQQPQQKSPAQMNPQNAQSPESLKQMKDEDSKRKIEENKQMIKDKSMYTPRTSSGPPGAAPGPMGPLYKPGMPNIKMPTSGIGEKRAFYTAQAETLRAMLPYWQAQQ